jgi:hypothetical protein
MVMGDCAFRGLKREWTLEGLAGGVALIDAVPESDVLFTSDPAEKDFLAFAMGQEVDEAGSDMSYDDAAVRNLPGQIRGPGHGLFHSLLGVGNLLFHAAVAVAAALSVDVDGVLLDAVFLFPGVVELVELLGKPGQHAAGFLEGEVTLGHLFHPHPFDKLRKGSIFSIKGEEGEKMDSRLRGRRGLKKAIAIFIAITIARRGSG